MCEEQIQVYNYRGSMLMTRDVGRDAFLRDDKWTPVQVSSLQHRKCSGLACIFVLAYADGSSLNFVPPRTGPEPGVGNLHFAHHGPARGATRAEHHAAARRGVWNAFSM